MMTLTRAISAAAISLAVAVLPSTSRAQSLLLRAPARDLTTYLPRLNDVPWLTREARASRRSTLPEGGNVNALLFTHTPVPAWSRQYTEARMAPRLLN